jgi:hypothetical protein
MNPQFLPLTRHEMFFGITPNGNFSTGGATNSTELITKAAATPVNKPYIPPSPNLPHNSDMIPNQQTEFLLTDFLWKYRWEIGIGSILIAGAIWYGYSVSQNEEKKHGDRSF